MQKFHSNKMKLPFQGDAVIVSKLGFCLFFFFFTWRQETPGLLHYKMGTVFCDLVILPL